jgi:hypothetical protein
MAALAVAALATPVRARAQGADCLVIETFADSQIGQFPLGWKALKDAGKVSYTVQEEAGLRFLRAVSSGLGIQAGREYEWTSRSIRAGSVLRPRAFPQGADERDSSRTTAHWPCKPCPLRIRGPSREGIWANGAGRHTAGSNMGLTGAQLRPTVRRGTVDRGRQRAGDTRGRLEPPAASWRHRRVRR